MSKKRKIAIFILIATISTGVLYCLFAWLLRDDKIELKSGYVFTEQSLLFNELDDEEKNIINGYLDNHYIEDKGFYLMTDNDYSVFEKIYAAYYLMDKMDDDNKNQAMEQLLRVFRKCEQNINNYNIPAYDYMYYVAVKHELCETVESEQYQEKLSRNVDINTGLIYYLSADEDLDTKLLISSKIVDLCNKYNIDIEKFDLYNKVLNICSNYKLIQKKDGKTLYNSGGTLIYILKNWKNKYSVSTEMNEWFNGWEEYYSDFTITDEISYIEYYSYYQISQFFDNSESEKIEKYIREYNFYDLDKSDFELIDLVDYFYEEFYDVLTAEQRNQVSNYVCKEIDRIEKRIIENNTIDIPSTFYGTVLAYETGYDLNYEKCRSTVENLYNSIMKQLENKEFVYNTYYYIMFMNNFEVKKICEEMYGEINERLDDIIDETLEDENIDVGLLRYALEIKSYMASYVYESSYNRIKYLINKVINEECYNSRIIDIIKIDYILNTNIVGEKYFDKCVEVLFSEGGYCCKEGEKPDLKTTYLFYSMTTNHGIFNPSENEVENMKQFVEGLSNNGLYCYESDDGYADFRSIYYGYTLKKLIFAGGKNAE